MRRPNSLIVLTGAIVAAASVSAFRSQQEPTKEGTSPTKAAAILDDKCGKCHNPKVKFDPKSRLGMVMRGALIPGKSENSKIVQVVVAGSMPPAGSPKVTDEELATIKSWIDEGAKDWAASPATAQKILADNCSKCHKPFMDTSKETRATLLEKGVLVPGKAEDSKIIKALHAGAMPPPGNPKPTEAEVALLAGWVNAGAIDWTVLPTRASTILDTNCSKCHNGSTGFDVKNLSSLTDKSLIVAGKVSESKLLAKIISGQMPPAGNPAVRARDLAVLKAWVEDGAADWKK